MRTKAAVAVVTAALSGVLGCGTASPADLTIPGSGNPEYVLRALANEFNGRQREHRVTVPPSSGTAGAIRDVLSDKAVLGRVGRRVTEEERAKGLAFVAVGRDAVVFVAGADVSVRSVTTSQMLDAFTGKITDWRALGAKAGPIRAVGRETGDASWAALAKAAPAFRDLTFGSGVKIVHLDPQLIELLDRYGTSLGLLNRSALYAATTRVVPLALDAVEATAENVLSGRYPVVLELGLIHKAGDALPAAGQAFLAFLRSPDGLRILRAHSVVPPQSGS
jgi:phosphate transport system substrate-binding protein